MYQRKEILGRTELLVGEGALEKLGRLTVLVAGLGGTGGGQAVALARMGIGKLIIADPGKFDPPDMNRQWAASASTLGANKADVYARLLKDVNPLLEVESHREGITNSNIRELVSRSDLVCDNLDIQVPGALRRQLFSEARAKGIYSMSCPIMGFGALMCASDPSGLEMDVFWRLLDRILRTRTLPRGLATVYDPAHLELIEKHLKTGPVPSNAIATLISASLAVNEATNILCREHLLVARDPICLPRLVMADLFNMKTAIVDISSLDLE